MRGQVLGQVGNNVATSPDGNTTAADWTITHQTNGTVLTQNISIGGYLGSDPNRGRFARWGS